MSRRTRLDWLYDNSFHAEEKRLICQHDEPANGFRPATQEDRDRLGAGQVEKQQMNDAEKGDVEQQVQEFRETSEALEKAKNEVAGAQQKVEGLKGLLDEIEGIVVEVTGADYAGNGEKINVGGNRIQKNATEVMPVHTSVTGELKEAEVGLGQEEKEYAEAQNKFNTAQAALSPEARQKLESATQTLQNASGPQEIASALGRVLAEIIKFFREFGRVMNEAMGVKREEKKEDGEKDESVKKTETAPAAKAEKAAETTPESAPEDSETVKLMSEINEKGIRETIRQTEEAVSVHKRDGDEVELAAANKKLKSIDILDTEAKKFENTLYQSFETSRAKVGGLLYTDSSNETARALKAALNNLAAAKVDDKLDIRLVKQNQIDGSEREYSRNEWAHIKTVAVNLNIDISSFEVDANHVVKNPEKFCEALKKIVDSLSAPAPAANVPAAAAEEAPVAGVGARASTSAETSESSSSSTSTATTETGTGTTRTGTDTAGGAEIMTVYSGDEAGKQSILVSTANLKFNEKAANVLMLGEYLRDAQRRIGEILNREELNIKHAEQARNQGNRLGFGTFHRWLTKSDPYKIEIGNSRKKIGTAEYIRDEFLRVAEEEMQKPPESVDIVKVVDDLNKVLGVCATINNQKAETIHLKEE